MSSKGYKGKGSHAPGRCEHGDNVKMTNQTVVKNNPAQGGGAKQTPITGRGK